MSSIHKRSYMAVLFNFLMVLLSFGYNHFGRYNFGVFTFFYLLIEVLIYLTYLSVFSKIKKTKTILMISPILYTLNIIINVYFNLLFIIIISSILFLFLQLYYLKYEKSLVYDIDEEKEKQKMFILSIFIWNLILYIINIALTFIFIDNIVFILWLLISILISILINRLILSINKNFFKISISIFQKLILYFNIPVSLIFFYFTCNYNQNIIVLTNSIFFKNAFVESFFAILILIPYLYLNNYFFKNLLNKNVNIILNKDDSRSKMLNKILKINITVSIVFTLNILLSIVFFYQFYFKVYVSLIAVLSVIVLIYRNYKYNILHENKINKKWIIIDFLAVIFSTVYCFLINGDYPVIAFWGTLRITFNLFTYLIAAIIYMPSAVISKKINIEVNHELKYGEL